jgi:hypothetical protein
LTLVTGYDSHKTFSQDTDIVDKKYVDDTVSGGMVYPGAGIVVSTGSAWGTPIVNNSANWDTAYSWGDHASAGYLTTESDPLFTAWDKSTGISITESQISDLGAYITDLSGFDTDDLAEGSTNKYFPGFTDLLTDYGFTDNSSNWNTAYSWGNHASEGYLTGSTGVPKSSFTTAGGELVGTRAGTFQQETGATLRPV